MGLRPTGKVVVWCRLSCIEIWERVRPYRKLQNATASPLMTRQIVPQPPSDAKDNYVSPAAHRRLQRLEQQLQENQRQQLGLMLYPTDKT